MIIRNCNRETRNEVRKSNRRKYKKFKGLDTNLSFIVLNTIKFVRLFISYFSEECTLHLLSIQAKILILFKRATSCSFLLTMLILVGVFVFPILKGSLFFMETFFFRTHNYSRFSTNWIPHRISGPSFWWSYFINLEERMREFLCASQVFTGQRPFNWFVHLTTGRKWFPYNKRQIIYC